jgi:hypothetical protein
MHKSTLNFIAIKSGKKYEVEGKEGQNFLHW